MSDKHAIPPSGSPRRDHFDGLVAFATLAETRNFRAAAQRLGVSPSALSQTIRLLEARVGAPLLARTTRQVGLTQAGEAFLAGVRPAIAHIETALTQATTLGGNVTGLLRLNVPRAACGLLFTQLLQEFLTLHPGLEVELFASDSFDNVLADGFDAGVRLGETLDSDMVAVPVAPSFAFAVYGSPGYLQRNGRPLDPADLADHRCIRFRSSDGRIYRWQFVRDGRMFEMDVTGSLIVNDSATNLAAAEAGEGLAYAASPLAQVQVEEGRLEPVLAGFLPVTPGLFLYYPGRAQALPRLTALVEFLRAKFRQRAAVMPPSTKTAEPVR
jgi:DNA-binding transcriptional LysR family regulator